MRKLVPIKKQYSKKKIPDRLVIVFHRNQRKPSSKHSAPNSQKNGCPEEEEFGFFDCSKWYQFNFHRAWSNKTQQRADFVIFLNFFHATLNY